MTYSGNLVRTAQRPDAKQLPFPSAAHGDLTTPDPYPVSHEVPAGTGQEYAGSAIPVDQVVGGGLTLDTPALWERGNPHDSTAVLWLQRTDQQRSDELAHAHDGAEDRGYMRSTYAKPPLQAAYQVRADMWFDGFTTPFQATGQADMLKYVQGINSRPENNPARDGYVNGFRPGVTRQLAPNIERPAHPHRTYDVQPLTERDFYYPTNQPNAGDNGGEGGPVFPSMARPIATFMQRPALWRDAGNFDDAMMSAAPVDTTSAVIDGSVF